MSDPIIMRLWDYGWLAHERIILGASDTEGNLIKKYCESPEFHRSFQPQSDADETGIHGPFPVNRVCPSDFVRLTVGELPDYLESIVVSRDSKDDVVERRRLLERLTKVFDDNPSCYMLSVDERNEDLKHDWGFIYDLFRELVFLSIEEGIVDRYIIGYD